MVVYHSYAALGGRVLYGLCNYDGCFNSLILANFLIIIEQLVSYREKIKLEFELLICFNSFLGRLSFDFVVCSNLTELLEQDRIWTICFCECIMNHAHNRCFR